MLEAIRKAENSQSNSRYVNRIRTILKKCMKSIERRTMYVCLYLQKKDQKIKLNFVLLYCVLKKIKTLKFEII